MTIPDSAYVPEIEQGVLGALLYGGKLSQVSGFLREDHFVSDLHRLLFRAIQSADQQYGSTAVPVVLRFLPPDAEVGFRDKTGETPAAYMARLSASVVAGNAGLVRSGRAVVDQWARLKVGEIGETVRAAAHDPTAEAKALVKAAAAELDTVAGEIRAGPRRKTRMTIAEASSAAISETKDAMARGHGLTGVTWGLSDVNRVTGGIHRSEMTVIGARPSMGKSALALSVALKAAGTGVGVGLISLEMTASRLATRALTDMGYNWGVKVPYFDLLSGRVDPAHLESLIGACRDIDRLPLWIEEQPGLSLTDIRVKLDHMLEDAEARRTPLQLLFVDYLQLIRPSERYRGNRNNEITEISAGLREIAREHNIGVVALSQLSRSIESRPLKDRRPVMSDLRDSGAIEQDADTIAFLFREGYYLEKDRGADADAEAERISRLIDCQNKLEFIIAKQRNGPVTTVDLFVDMACSAVRNAARFQ